MSAEEEKAEMGRFAKNFLPIFFNVYSLQPAAGESGTYRMAILDTIKVYLTVTPTEVSHHASSAQGSCELLKVFNCCFIYAVTHVNWKSFNIWNEMILSSNLLAVSWHWNEQEVNNHDQNI